MKNTSSRKHSVGARSFLTAIAVIFVLMVATYVLTLVLPGGEYARVTDETGNTVIDTAGGFTHTEGGIPFWKWALSPFLVLGASGSGALIAVIAFLLVIGGIFEALEKSGLITYMLGRLTQRFGRTRYRLLAVITFFFMALGAAIGSFEECVPLVPLSVALSVSLGWDAMTGIGMSLLATGCGFASGVCNPFTVGVAQELAGLPMFSGFWLRLLAFILIYILLFTFLFLHARKIARPIEGAQTEVMPYDARMHRGLLAFAIILGLGILIVLSSGFIPALQSLTMIIVAVMFLVAGITATLLCGMRAPMLGSRFCHGLVAILPAVIMILMAASIKYTLEEASVMDTILHGAVKHAEYLPAWSVILFIYLIVLVMNFFIPSGSAKAFMLIPLIVPLAQLFGLSTQLCIVAFAFGDGFSNVFYPTNPALLISLGLAETSYGKWFKFSWRFQALNLLLTSGILLLGLAVGY